MSDKTNYNNKIIDVLFAIDSDGVLKKCGKNTDPNNPTFIGNENLIFMITKQDKVVSGQAGNELKIKGTLGDAIRWRETTLSMDSNTDVLLYKLITPSTTCAKLISPPKVTKTKINVPLPDSDASLEPTMEKIINYYWHSIFLKTGDGTYNFNFMIIDAAAQILGYYSWDLLITIAP